MARRTTIPARSPSVSSPTSAGPSPPRRPPPRRHRRHPRRCPRPSAPPSQRPASGSAGASCNTGRPTAGWRSRGFPSPTSSTRSTRPMARPTGRSTSSAPASSTTRRTPPPYEVLLGLLGREQFQARYGRSQPAAPATRSAGECATFAQTGKRVCGAFLQYWHANGGLAQQGLPLDRYLPRDQPDQRQAVPDAVLRARPLRVPRRERQYALRRPPRPAGPRATLLPLRRRRSRQRPGTVARAVARRGLGAVPRAAGEWQGI